MSNSAFPWTAAHQATLSSTVSSSLLKFVPTELLMLSNYLISFSFCLWSFLALGSFPMSWLFASGGQRIGASAPASVLPRNIQDWFPLGLTGLNSLQSKRLSRVFFSTIIWKCQFFSAQPFLWSNSHICMTRKTTRGFPCGSAGKESACKVGDLGLIPVLGRSSGEGKGYPLQYSGIENSMDCTVPGVAKSRTWLSDFHFH